MKWRRRVNSLKGIDANGGWVEDPVVVKDVIKNFFEQKFKEEGGDSPNLDGICFNQVSATDNAFLTAEFSADEIKEVVWECDGNRCPGPDGYNFTFLKEFWDLLKEDVKKVLDDFHSSGK